MTNLVLLATVFITLNGFARSYPSRTLNQPTNRLDPAAFTLPTKIDNQKREDSLCVEAYTDGVDVKLRFVPQSTIPTSGQNKNEESISDDEYKKEKKITWKSNIDQLNKWRLPRMENKNLPMVFILRTNDYKK